MEQPRKRQDIRRQWELVMLLPISAPGLTERELLDRLREKGYATDICILRKDLQTVATQIPLGKQSRDTGDRWWISLPHTLSAADVPTRQRWPLPLKAG